MLSCAQYKGGPTKRHNTLSGCWNGHKFPSLSFLRHLHLPPANGLANIRQLPLVFHLARNGETYGQPGTALRGTYYLNRCFLKNQSICGTSACSTLAIFRLSWTFSSPNYCKNHSITEHFRGLFPNPAFIEGAAVLIDMQRGIDPNVDDPNECNVGLLGFRTSQGNRLIWINSPIPKFQSMMEIGLVKPPS